MSTSEHLEEMADKGQVHNRYQYAAPNFLFHDDCSLTHTNSMMLNNLQKTQCSYHCSPFEKFHLNVHTGTHWHEFLCAY